MDSELETAAYAAASVHLCRERFAAAAFGHANAAVGQSAADPWAVAYAAGNSSYIDIAAADPVAGVGKRRDSLAYTLPCAGPPIVVAAVGPETPAAVGGSHVLGRVSSFL